MATSMGSDTDRSARRGEDREPLPFWRHIPLAEMIRYGLVGLVNTAVCLSAIFVSMHVIGLPYALANAIGYALGLIASFLLNRRFTFRSSRRIFSREPLLFLGALVLFVEQLRMNQSFAQVCAMVVYTACGYTGNKFITFRGRTPSSAADGKSGPSKSC
jgi:putative flippase GtrA